MNNTVDNFQQALVELIWLISIPSWKGNIELVRDFADIISTHPTVSQFGLDSQCIQHIFFDMSKELQLDRRILHIAELLSDKAERKQVLDMAVSITIPEFDFQQQELLLLKKIQSVFAI